MKGPFLALFSSVGLKTLKRNYIKIFPSRKDRWPVKESSPYD